MLIHPMNAFPWVLNGIVEANVSKGRLQKLLLPPKEAYPIAPETGDSGNFSETEGYACLCLEDEAIMPTMSVIVR